MLINKTKENLLSYGFCEPLREIKRKQKDKQILELCQRTEKPVEHEGQSNTKLNISIRNPKGNKETKAEKEMRLEKKIKIFEKIQKRSRKWKNMRTQWNRISGEGQQQQRETTKLEETRRLCIGVSCTVYSNTNKNSTF